GSAFGQPSPVHGFIPAQHINPLVGMNAVLGVAVFVARKNAARKEAEPGRSGDRAAIAFPALHHCRLHLGAAGVDVAVPSAVVEPEKSLAGTALDGIPARIATVALVALDAVAVPDTGGAG